jgi:glucose-1-phosphate adenylyltransferase
MNYLEMLQTHRRASADVTIAALPVTRQAAGSLGVMRVDSDGRVIGFVEKPQTEEQIESVRMPPRWFEDHGLDSRSRECLASMGIYLFNRDLLVDALRTTTHEDFGREVFPSLIAPRRVQVHLFDGYWEDIGTIRAFYEANLAIAGPNPPFDLASPETPIYSRSRFLPPSQFAGASIANSIIADGCRIGAGSNIENSVIGLRCMIGEGVRIRDSVIMGADEYESEHQHEENRARRLPPVGVGSGSVIVGAIVDKNCRIGRNVHVENTTRAVELDQAACAIRDSIPVIVKDAVLPDGWRLE